jgi:hypothetical protein
MATTTLDGILEPLSAVEFFAQSFHHSFVHVPGHPAKFSHLLPWPVLNDILRHHRLDPPQLKLMKDGRPLPIESFILHDRSRSLNIPRVSATSLTKALREGATLIIDRIDQIYEPITTLAQLLERIFRVSVGVNMYAGWRLSQGFDLHWDDHDVFVMQIAGRKRWTIYGETVKFPIARNPEMENNKPTQAIWEGILKAGDLLYIPRGWWHVAVPLDEPTLHLTVGLKATTGLSIFEWLTDQMGMEECMRMDIPLLEDAESQGEYLRHIQSAMVKVCTRPDLLQRFLRESTLRSEPRPALGLPWTATEAVLPEEDNYTLTFLPPRSLEVRHLKDTHKVEVDFRGQTFAFRDDAKLLLEFLVTMEPMPVAEFYRTFAESFDRDELRVFLADLVRHGIVWVRES